MNSTNAERKVQITGVRTSIQPGTVNIRRSKRKPVHSGIKHIKQSVEIDFDLLVSSIENSIMADQERGPVGLTPQELLVKSNPAMYTFEREFTRDLTNPREMYSILSHNSKSTEDLTAKFKQEISRKFQTSGVFPKLSRAISLNEIRRLPHGKSDKLGSFQSASEILKTNKKLNVLVVTRHQTNLEGIRTITEEDKENLHALNLPHITRNNLNHSEVGIIHDKEKKVQQGLPTLSTDQNAGRRIASDVDDTEKVVKAATTGNQPINSNSLKCTDPKIDKWFSEMPNEVFDKAQRAIMEASIKDKLASYQYKRNKKENFPGHVNILHGTRLRKVPNTFLEVRVDSFEKHLKEERLNKYKMQQKSIHKLKMRELDEIERQEKMGREDIEFSPRLHLQYRSHTTLTQKNKSDRNTEKQKHNVVANHDDKCLKTFNINEVLKRDIMSRQRTRINNYEDYTERRHLSKSAHDAVSSHDDNYSDRDSVPKHCSPVSKESDVGDITGKTKSCIDRSVAKTSVVNIGIENSNDPKRRKHTSKDNTPAYPEEKDHFNIGSKAEQQDTDETNYKDTNKVEIVDKNDDSQQCITKIPTARSNRTSDSNKSTISSKQSPKPNKSVLSRFKKLEVFAEQDQADSVKMIRKNYHGHKLREQENRETTVPPAYKLDLKKYPQHFKNPVPDNEFVNTEVRKQEIIFRFEPGECFISRKPNLNRSSERARIIYGKVLNKDDRFNAGKAGDAKHAQDSSSVHSLSTRLDRYKFEIGNFEQRALADSAPSDSVREHIQPHTRISNTLGEETEYINRPDLETASTITKTPLECYNKFGKSVRDVCIETDVLGSEVGSLGFLTDDGSKLVFRPESSLSEYIVENDDGGESLNSDSEQNDYLMDSTIRQRRSMLKSRGAKCNLSH